MTALWIASFELALKLPNAPSSLRFAGALQILVLAFLLPAGCSKPNSNSSVTTPSIDYEISPRPPHVGPARITLRISDRAGNPISGASVRLEGNMTHAGMAPSFGTAEETAPGRYRATLDFSMSGDWLILVHVTLANGEKLEKQLAVKGVQPG